MHGPTNAMAIFGSFDRLAALNFTNPFADAITNTEIIGKIRQPTITAK
jgi:hypothetical protein